METTLHHSRRHLPGRRPKTRTADPDTRSQVLAAARSVFARRGFDGTSTREVAELAGVNNAMIYYHFKDKEELYRAVLADSFSAFEHVWDHAIFSTAAPVREKFRTFVDEFIRFQHENDDFRRIMSMEFATCSSNYKWLADTYFVHSYKRLARILKEGMRSGEIRKCDPSMVIPSLVGMIIHSFIMRPIAEHVTGKKLDLSVERFGTSIMTMFFEGLRTSPGTSARPRTVTTKRGATHA